jgi:glycerol-3-phosphate dehydrogenase
MIMYIIHNFFDHIILLHTLEDDLPMGDETSICTSNESRNREMGVCFPFSSCYNEMRHRVLVH